MPNDLQGMGECRARSARFVYLLSCIMFTLMRSWTGVISVGRISFDLSPELVSRLKVQSVPAILAATPKAGEGYAVTFLPQKELSLLTTGRIRRFLGTIPTRTPCTQLATE